MEGAVAEPRDMGTALIKNVRCLVAAIRIRRTKLTTTIRLLKMRRKLTLSR
jgi:hypothetical protein